MYDNMNSYRYGDLLRRVLFFWSRRRMTFGIFSRSTAGYIIVLLLLGGSNVYAIWKLAQFNSIILKSHIEDTRLIDYEKKMVDSLFSQLRYEQKFILTKDRALFVQFLAAKDDFERMLAEITSPSASPVYRDSFQKIKAYHQRYQSLVNTEAKYLKDNQKYDRSWYKGEKEKTTDAVLTELEKLEDHSRQDFYHQSKMVSEAGAAARRMAVISFMITGMFAILLSYLITRSITKPLMMLVKKTREIPTGMFSCDLDASSPPEIRELTDAFRLMCDRLKEVDRIKADFFAMISHELRTPLTTIKEGTNLLLEGVGGSITEKQDRLLNIIETESKRLTGLVNSILDLSKMESGMMMYTFQTGKIAPLIDQAIKEIGPYAEAKGIHLEKQLNADLSFYRMDGERILDVLRNLLGNAVKFTPGGGNVTVAANPLDNGGLKVSVSDSGPGIPKDRLAIIFEKYVSSDQKKGTGLGLAIVKHIVAAHGGKVWVESDPGKGSTFTFVLPS
jgi:two-component system, NtrC family, sensor histidine kinase GlrK